MTQDLQLSLRFMDGLRSPFRRGVLLLACLLAFMLLLLLLLLFVFYGKNAKFFWENLFNLKLTYSEGIFRSSLALLHFRWTRHKKRTGNFFKCHKHKSQARPKRNYWFRFLYLRFQHHFRFMEFLYRLFFLLLLLLLVLFFFGQKEKYIKNKNNGIKWMWVKNLSFMAVLTSCSFQKKVLTFDQSKEHLIVRFDRDAFREWECFLAVSVPFTVPLQWRIATVEHSKKDTLTC